MVLIDLNFEIKNELNQAIGWAYVLLAGSFMRIKINEESSIKKIEEFTQALIKVKSIKLDKSEIPFFRFCVINCDSFQVVKAKVLKVLEDAIPHSIDPASILKPKI